VSRKLVQEALRDFMERPGNTLKAHGGMRIWNEPLVAFADAGDFMFERLRDPAVGMPAFRPPGEWLPGAKTVISYFLPFSEEVRSSNYRPGLPSQEWCSARIEGEAFNDNLRRFLVAHLEALGYRAVAPALAQGYTAGEFTSNWSERHVAFTAGLGTFGLSRSLITQQGSAGRFGSIVTDLDVEATPRSYVTHYSHCPWLNRGECGACIDRCPSGAITPEGKDKKVCKRYIDEVVRPMFHPRYGCAKCQTRVPCETRIP